MCLVIFGVQVHPEYRLILATNRDEFYSRPTDAASWWSDETDKDGTKILSGRDGLSGGSWFGISRTGRFAAVTNYRDGSAPESANARSRGLLVTNWLSKKEATSEQFLKNIATNGNEYNGFNLIIGDTQSIWYYSNRSESNTGPIQITEPGIYGLSNELLDTPWPKLARAKKELTKVIDSGTVNREKLFQIMSDPWRPPDEELPDTKVGLHFERYLSSIFLPPIDVPTKSIYGTCCSTVLTIDCNDNVEFTERNFDDKGVVVTPDASFSFRIDRKSAE